DCVFLKNFSRFNFRIRYIPMGTSPSLSFFVSLRFRWDCKGRNLFGTSKKLFDFFSFPFFRFPRLILIKPFFFHGYLLSR
ncbi:hypothetical protein, partial [Sphingobacterium puteale]|uniref:hypothetical protein n=1 Tax=Sphingobacterium puteale TaxID=2420510 RepID=UPI001C7D6244